jgi:hypothetical protein
VTTDAAIANPSIARLRPGSTSGTSTC